MVWFVFVVFVVVSCSVDVICEGLGSVPSANTSGKRLEVTQQEQSTQLVHWEWPWSVTGSLELVALVQTVLML